MESNKATVAGILDITAGIFGFVGGIPLLVLALGGAAVLGMVPEPEANRLAFLPMALFLPLALLGFVSGTRSQLQDVDSPKPSLLNPARSSHIWPGRALLLYGKRKQIRFHRHHRSRLPAK